MEDLDRNFIAGGNFGDYSIIKDGEDRVDRKQNKSPKHQTVYVYGCGRDAESLCAILRRCGMIPRLRSSITD